MRSLEGIRDLQRTERPPSEARDCKEEVSRQRGGLVSKPNHPEMADADRGRDVAHFDVVDLLGGIVDVQLGKSG
jgi:hypothetical protein